MTERRIPPRQMRQFSSLSFTLEKILLGSLLGDGSCQISKGYQNARYQERHSIKQEEYFLWKISCYQEISSSRSVWYSSRSSSLSFQKKENKIRYQSRADENLTILSTIVHAKGNQKKITRKWLNSLTALSLAILWCDDGSLIANTKQGVFCLDSFSFEEQHLFVRYLRVVWGIETKIYPFGKKYRPVMNRSNLEKFCRIILPFIPVKSMLYKTTLLYKDVVLQERWISEMVNLSNFSLEVIQTIVSERKQTLKNFRK